MPVVASWDWDNRRIILGAANYDPLDIYREHRALRAVDEVARGYPPLVDALGGQPKGGGARFGNALRMVSGASFAAVPSLPMAKIVPLNGSGINVLGGEVVTDNPDIDPDPFDTSGLSNPPRIQLAPVAVIRTVNSDGSTNSGGGDATAAQQEAILGRLDVIDATVALARDHALGANVQTKRV